MKRLFCVSVLLCLIQFTHAQNIMGLYVDGFASILGNTDREDSLLRFAENNGFNYLTLYQMHMVNANTPLTNTTTAQPFANFVHKAKTEFNMLQIGVASENFNAFNNVYHVYNLQHSDPTERIDVYNLEFEFWVSSSVEPGGVYCEDYLDPAGIPCDTSGGFDFFASTLHKIDSLAALDGVLSEAYFGWFNEGQGAEIVQTGVDRVLISAYIPSASYDQSYLQGYMESRLQRLASAETEIKVLALMSAEQDMMHDWAASNPFFLPYFHFEDNMENEPASWAQYIHPEGIQWFAYTDMPLKNMDLNLDENTAISFTISPNPSSGRITVSSSEFMHRIEVLDVNGNVLEVYMNTQQLELNDLHSGVYFIRVANAKGSSVKKCVVI